MKLCSKTHQIAPFNKKFSWKHSSKSLQQAKSGMQLAQTPKKLIPLANPAYAHGKIYFNSWGSNP